MKKDVIYIDVEDDITAIIGKVQESSEKIVAIVPPKRVGVLQSAVNLKLLQRAAEQSGKRIVLITGNQSLVALSAAAMIPVAKTLQSKPELAEVSALDIDDGEDVIDGAELPVGEYAKQAEAEKTDNADLIEGVDIENPEDKNPSKKSKKSPKVPDFNKFRKKMILTVIGVMLLVITLVWAFVFAPAATVIISAKTSEASVNDVAKLGAINDAERGEIKAMEQSTEKEVSIEFAATGEKDVGQKAAGSVRLSTGSISNLGKIIPAGTKLTSTSGKAYSTTESISFSLSNYSGVTVGITAVASGESYNGAVGAMSGAPSGVSAVISNSPTGGTTKVVAVVTAADVQAAKEKMVKQSSDAEKTALMAKFTGDDKAIETSFKVDYADVSASPAVGQESESKKATLKAKAKYSLVGVAGSDLKEYLDQSIKKQMKDQTTQKIYGNGIDGARLNDYRDDNGNKSVRVVTSGQIGPVINEDEIKQQVAGKRFGEIQSEIEKIDGVNDVQVEFSHFWVRKVPKNPEKITIEFEVQNASQ